MHRRQQRRRAPKAKATNFDPLLQVLRGELSSDWGFYKEFLEGAKAAIVRGESIAAWVEQIEPLVQEPAQQFAHQGVLFLLREMEGEMRSKAPSTNNMPPPSLPPPSLPPRKSLPLPKLPHQPSNINMQHNYETEHKNSQLLNYNIPTRYHAMGTASSTPRPRGIQRGLDPVLFEDPHFKQDVQDHFGVPRDKKIKRDYTNLAPTPDHDARVAPVYKSEEDDLAAWNKRNKDGGEVKIDSEAKDKEQDDGTPSGIPKFTHYDPFDNFGAGFYNKRP